MSLTSPPVAKASDLADPSTKRSKKKAPAEYQRTGFWRGATLVLLVLVWVTPLLAVFITSFRTTRQVSSTGWWEALIPPWGFTQ